MRTAIVQISLLGIFMCSPGSAEVAEKTRASIDALTGAKGAYTAGEDVYRQLPPLGPQDYD